MIPAWPALAEVVAGVVYELRAEAPIPSWITHSQRAERRSLALFQEHCTPEQWKEFEDNHCLTVVGRQSGARYLITDQPTYNVECLDDVRFGWRPWPRARKGISLCFFPVGTMGVGDKFLVQKLALEHEEEVVFLVANKQYMGARSRCASRMHLLVASIAVGALVAITTIAGLNMANFLGLLSG